LIGYCKNVIPYMLNWIKETVYWPALHGYERALENMLFSPYFMGGIILILILEKIIPAKKDQKILRLGLIQDAVWVFIEIFFQAVVVAAYSFFLKSLFENYCSYLTMEATGRWPYWIRFAWGIILADFLAWVHHWLKHKVSWFWLFHAVHHSQKELNMFTDLRYHFVEYLISRTVVVIPLLIFAVDVPQITIYIIIKDWYTRFYHSNIKTNLGVLRYIFVTPQSHRIHHSMAKEHRDKNFAVIFSVWDFLFHTQYCGFNEYPETGITDEEFPLETKAEIKSLILTPLRQLIYPFQVVARRLNQPKPKKEN